jgi:hypothetical protein
MRSPSDNEIRSLIRSRIADYTVDVAEERRKLVELWRKAHPEAAAEHVSGVHRPLILLDKRAPSDEAPDEEWANDVYSVTLRRRPDKDVRHARGYDPTGHQQPGRDGAS